MASPISRAWGDGGYGHAALYSAAGPMAAAGPTSFLDSVVGAEAQLARGGAARVVLARWIVSTQWPSPGASGAPGNQPRRILTR